MVGSIGRIGCSNFVDFVVIGRISFSRIFCFCYYISRLYSFGLSSIVITSLVKEGAGCCAGCLFMCPRVVVSRFTSVPLGAGGGLRYLL